MSYLYYVEHENIESGNVIAVQADVNGNPLPLSASRRDVCRVIAAEQYYPNSPVHETITPVDYLLGEYCRKVDEGEARRIHPRLFAFLEKVHRDKEEQS